MNELQKALHSKNKTPSRFLCKEGQSRNKKREKAGVPSQEALTEQKEAAQICKSHQGKRTLRALVTQEHQQTTSPSKPPIEAGCLCAKSHQSSAVTRPESSASGYPASRPR